MLSWHVGRDVTKISNCQVNTTSGRGIKQLGIPFGSVFLLFSYATSRGKSPAHSSQWQLCLDFIHVVFAPIDQCRDFKNNFMVLLVLFHLPPWKWWGIILIFHEPLRYYGNENFHFKSEYSFYDIFFCETIGPFIRGKIRRVLNKTRTVPFTRACLI